MNSNRKYILCLILIIVILLCSSCSSRAEDGTLGGILVDSDVLSSIIKEIGDKEDSLLAADNDVFWTPSGTTWHATHKCSHIADSKTVYHGSVEEAMLEGKEKACSRCFLDEMDKIYEALLNAPVNEGDVFFTRNTDSWHEDINCACLHVNETIYNASIAKAEELGKVACEECKQ